MRSSDVGFLSGATGCLIALALSSAHAQELKEFNFLSPNSTTCGPYAQAVSDEVGFFAEEGLKVNLLNSETSINFVAFLANGQADAVNVLLHPIHCRSGDWSRRERRELS